METRGPPSQVDVTPLTFSASFGTLRRHLLLGIAATFRTYARQGLATTEIGNNAEMLNELLSPETIDPNRLVLRRYTREGARRESWN